MDPSICVFLVSRCTWIYDAQGKPKRFNTADQQSLIQSVIEPMACDGLRTICLAYKDFVTGTYNTYTSVHCVMAVTSFPVYKHSKLNRKRGNASAAHPVGTGFRERS